jgi:hypothetical protein
MRLAIFLTLFFLLPFTVRADGFFQSVTDLPLMTGLQEVREAALIYDKPEGRIVELTARSLQNTRISEKGVREFYASTLPQLGWQRQANTFVRDGEVLRLTFVKENNLLMVYLSINPK